MDYLGNKVVAVTGSSGFIGKRLINALTGSVGQLILMVRKVDHKIMRRWSELCLYLLTINKLNFDCLNPILIVLVY